ncbi:MAG: IPTL-CTERM sorting domain-containing protein, partial [Variovorax sp.]
ANNGGPTLTHKPAATSPAVNAGDPAFAPPPTTDQRDLPRVVNTVIDMGSVELGAAGTIQLTFSTSSVAENAGTVTVTATRTGGSEGAVSITVNTVNNSAIAPGDYTAVVNSVLNWADGDTAPKSLNITIINDTEDEPDEDFIVTISNPTGGAALGSPATAQITILDDDLPISVIEVPTVGEWGLVFLTGLLAMAGMYRLRRKQGLAAPMLILTLMAGGANIATAANAVPPAVRVRDARAVTLSQVVPSAGTVSLQLSDGSIVQVNVADLEIKDRRDPRGRLLPQLRVQDLAPGQPLVVKVRRGENGVVKKVRVQVFDPLARAQQALERHQQ